MFNTDDITVLLAGAGCGKTSFLIQKFKEELVRFRPEDIAFVSFTRKGAYEGKHRIISDTGIEPDSLPYFRTLHSLTYQALNLPKDSLFARKDADELNDTLGFSITLSDTPGAGTLDDEYLGVYNIERSGNTDIDYNEIPRFNRARYERLINAYDEYRHLKGKYDYTDCLEMFVKNGEAIPVRLAFIDEAQDLTTLQWEVCRVAFQRAEKIYIAGDDYQSIFTYAGARPDILLSFARKYPLVKLETSYRLPKKVYRFSKAITDLISEKIDKDYKPFKKNEGTVRFISDRQELVELIYKNSHQPWMCLFRTNRQYEGFSDMLRSRLILFSNNKGFCINQRHLSLIRKYYNYRKEGYGTEEEKKAFAEIYRIEDFNNDFIKSELIPEKDAWSTQAYVDKYGIEELIRVSREEPKILVSTMHRVKGAESRNVAVFLDTTLRVERNKYKDPDSELRLLYVAMTRAKENLYLVTSEGKYGYDELLHTIKEDVEHE